ncbi:hypothetical protein ACFSCX_08145 [Bacillus salitolerans]|uniref:Uncharacterized protein n=1 Tax=Bacillus salitolerans TaxID=1437434 RepID=A0ABW4LN04_9BACI
MKSIYGIELLDASYADIIEPFLPITHSFLGSFSSIYLFNSYEDISYLQNQLEEYEIIDSVHHLLKLENVEYFEGSGSLNDYGFKFPNQSYYVIRNMVRAFSILSGDEQEIKMALLQFDEHLLAKQGKLYVVDAHHQGLIEKIAEAYNITVSFLNLDKMV